jgi:hypothetical protein
VTLIAALERSGKALICTTGSGIVGDSAGGEYASSLVFTEDTYFEPVPFRRPRVAMNRFVREAAIDKGIRSVVVCPSMIYGKGAGATAEQRSTPENHLHFPNKWAQASILEKASIVTQMCTSMTSWTCTCSLLKRLPEVILFRGKRPCILQGNCGDGQPLFWARRQDSQPECRGRGTAIRRCRSLRRDLQQHSKCGQRTAARLVSQSTFSC